MGKGESFHTAVGVQTATVAVITSVKFPQKPKVGMQYGPATRPLGIYCHGLHTLLWGHFMSIYREHPCLLLLRSQKPGNAPSAYVSINWWHVMGRGNVIHLHNKIISKCDSCQVTPLLFSLLCCVKSENCLPNPRSQMFPILFVLTVMAQSVKMLPCDPNYLCLVSRTHDGRSKPAPASCLCCLKS